MILLKNHSMIWINKVPVQCVIKKVGVQVVSQEIVASNRDYFEILVASQIYGYSMNF